MQVKNSLRVKGMGWEKKRKQDYRVLDQRKRRVRKTEPKKMGYVVVVLWKTYCWFSFAFVVYLWLLGKSDAWWWRWWWQWLDNDDNNNADNNDNNDIVQVL